MVADAEHARDGRPVLALSRTDPASVAALAAWVTERLADFRSGTLVPVDPGPMAAHAHMLTATRTEVRSSHLRAFRARTAARGSRWCPSRRCCWPATTSTVTVRVGARPGAGDRRARRHRRLRDARRSGPLGRRRSRSRPAARLVWHGEPFVVAEGADVRRTTWPSTWLPAPGRRSGRPWCSVAPARARAAASRGPTSTATACRCWSRSWTRPSGWVRTGWSTRCWAGASGGLERSQAAARAPRHLDHRPMVLESGDRLHRWLGAETHASPVAVRQSSPSAE